jgi:16S rRNA processing protein RimM
VTTHKPSRVTVARVVRPHGRHGEVACEILTDFPDRLMKLKVAQLWDGESEPRRVEVRSCWISQSHGGQAIFHFDGSNSIVQAEGLVGLDVQIPLEQRMELPAGNYYVTDLVDCEVISREGAPVGTVADVQFTGEDVAGTPILVLNSAAGELLIPLAEEICVEVDVAAKRIRIVPPEGLLDLNRNS